MKVQFVRSVALAALLVCSSCTKSGSDNEGGGGGGGGSSGGEAFRTDCGTVMGGSIENPVDPGDGFRGSVRVAGPNLLIISLPSGDQLIKLHDIEAPFRDFKQDGSMRVLKRLAAEEGIFFPADTNCVANLPNGGAGAIGQMFTASGLSYSEQLIRAGVADIGTDPCGGELISSCYQGLADTNEQEIAGELDSFLWKPVSDSNGRLAIHTGPYDTTVIVNGEKGTNQGAGNGYGSLARFGKAGCAYGGNVKVEVRNSSGAAYLVNGEKTITIPNGCNRYCLQGGNIVQCAKS